MTPTSDPVPQIQTADIATKTDIANLKEILGVVPDVAAGMPELGTRCLLQAVHGRMVHPTLPDALHELAPGKITRAVFDWWHQMQWLAGKVKLADV